MKCHCKGLQTVLIPAVFPCVMEECEVADREQAINATEKACAAAGLPVKIVVPSWFLASNSVWPTQASSTNGPLATGVPTSEPADTDAGTSLSPAAIAGVAVGVTLGVVLLAVGAWLLRRRRAIRESAMFDGAPILVSENKVVAMSPASEGATEGSLQYHGLDGDQKPTTGELEKRHETQLAHERGGRAELE